MFRGEWLQNHLSLRNGAKRSVSKGGNRPGADAPHDRGSSVLHVAILRDAPLRYAPQDEGYVGPPIIVSEAKAPSSRLVRSNLRALAKRSGETYFTYFGRHEQVPRL